MGSAVNDTTREVGGALGIALLSSLLSVGFRNSLGTATNGLPAPAAEAARDSIGAALQVAGEVGGAAGRALAEVAAQAFADGMLWSMGAGATLLLATAAIVSYFHPDRVSEVEGDPIPTAKPESEVVPEVI